MGPQLNFIFSLFLLSGSLLAIGLVMKKQLDRETELIKSRNRDHLELDYLQEEIRQLMYQLTTQQFENIFGSKEVYERELNKRTELKKALKGCTNGSLEDKSYIIDLISDLLIKYLIKKEEVDKVIYFDKPQFLSEKDMFDILMFDYWRNYRTQGLSQLIEEEKWDQLQQSDNEELPVYAVSREQIVSAYRKRRIQLTFEDKIIIIAQRIYENYKGFGVIDRIRDMSIDGISGGVSGVIDTSWEELPNRLKTSKQLPRNYDSVWIFYKGKSIYLSFLSFGNHKELKRICQNIYRYNKAGQLSENIGYKVNEMQDGSRVVVVRPPFSESWAFFVRKFHLKNIALEHLFQGEDSDKLIQMMIFLMRGARITAITGSQGSGKTTLLMSLVQHIYPTMTLRVQEMAFELHLRKLYPYRNVLTFKETETISGQAGLDLQKKTDGTVNILGEIATDEISVLMLQMAQVASLFTLFTHHAKTLKDLVLSLRNSLLKCDVFRDEKVAEEQVVRVLDFEIHMEKDSKGHRYIERISEIVLCEKNEHNFDKHHETYQENIIVQYNHGSYDFINPITQNQVELMKKSMEEKDGHRFIEFINQQWSEVNYGVNREGSFEKETIFQGN